ncbi:hypothetical protein [Halobacillus sp. A5]|uniref:hypothetical protein n=1 Tax=Halobacillus sp. A5 TaxID=2880263 RepID=UPI0020A69BF3|nr:hypothetical protein [Halobacillus sp. A5]MCP3027563.1 hypothetical protein [Halobacillus sp. A5]
MFRAAAILLILFTVGCGQNLDESQGHTNRQDIMNMGLEDDPNTTPENPRSIERVGDTWGVKEVRQQISEAAQTIPGVDVERIIIEADNAWVTVSVADDLSGNELERWTHNVEERITNAVPDYNVTVKVKPA